MLGTLILLYALDTGQVPTACYVMLWVFAIVEYFYKSIRFLVRISEKYGKENNGN